MSYMTDVLAILAILLSAYTAFRTRGVSARSIGYKELKHQIKLWLGLIQPPIDGGNGGNINFQPGKGGRGNHAKGGVDGHDGQILFKNADGLTVAYIDESGFLRPFHGDEHV